MGQNDMEVFNHFDDIAKFFAEKKGLVLVEKISTDYNRMYKIIENHINSINYYTVDEIHFNFLVDIYI